MRKHFFLIRYQILTSILFLILVVGFQTISEESVRIAIPPNRIALTFDDGPYPASTEKLLQLLKQENIKATFFIVGEMAEKYPYLLKLLASEGQEVANHTFSHPNLTKLTRNQIIEELEKTRLLIKKYTEKDAYFFRPPGGNYNLELKNIYSPTGYRMILWTVFPQDHLNLSPDEIYQRVIEKVHPNGIILLHSGRENTFLSLPKIIHSLRQKNYTFVTISELVSSTAN